jgi:hypothetical protein
MPDQPRSERFKASSPQIPGVAAPRPANTATTAQPGFKPLRFAAFLGAVFVSLLIVRWILHPKTPQARVAAPPPQIEVPPAAPDPSASLPHVTESEPGLATVSEMNKPWISKNFIYRNRLTGQSIPAIIIRLPSGSPAQGSGYWAFSATTPFGNCQFEYVTDVDKLRRDYGFAAARHPMVGNPCSRTVFDPTKLMSIPGGIWVRGAIAQGSDLRPPLGIEIEVHGQDILATRME